MPWCPECGAEYREGIEACAKCEVALQATPPPREDLAKAQTLRLLRAGGRATKEALSHAAAGWRVLRRHPALLVLPLLVALLHVGGWAMLSETLLDQGLGAQFPAEDPLTLSEALQYAPGVMWGMLSYRSIASGTSACVIPGPRLSLLIPAYAVYLGSRHTTWETGEDFWRWCELEVGYLLEVVASAFLLGAFFGQVRRAARGEGGLWSEFARDGRRYWLRFFLLVIVIGVISGEVSQLWLLSGHALLAPSIRSWFGFVTGIWALGARPVVNLFLALAWCAIVVDDARLGQALRRSVVTVGRTVGVGFCLLLLLSIIRLLLLSPVKLANVLLALTLTSRFYFPLTVLASVLLASVVWAVIATWFSLTALHWYRTARAKIAAAEMEAVA